MGGQWRIINDSVVVVCPDQGTAIYQPIDKLCKIQICSIRDVLERVVEITTIDIDRHSCHHHAFLSFPFLEDMRSSVYLHHLSQEEKTLFHALLRVKDQGELK